MSRASSLALLAALAALAAPLAARAETYRWVDERGVVNYASARPAGVKHVETLTRERSRLSTVPGIPAEQLQRERERLLEARVRRLEQAAEDLRRARVLALPPPVTYAAPLAYDYPYPIAYGYGYPYYGIPAYPRPRFRPGFHPTPVPHSSGMRAGVSPHGPAIGTRGRVGPR